VAQGVSLNASRKKKSGLFRPQNAVYGIRRVFSKTLSPKCGGETVARSTQPAAVLHDPLRPSVSSRKCITIPVEMRSIRPESGRRYPSRTSLPLSARSLATASSIIESKAGHYCFLRRPTAQLMIFNLKIFRKATAGRPLQPLCADFRRSLTPLEKPGRARRATIHPGHVRGEPQSKPYRHRRQGLLSPGSQRQRPSTRTQSRWWT